MTDSNYVFDQEKMEEMVRLNVQGMFLTRGMGGVLPEQSKQELALFHDVLDLACGPGEWALQLTFEHPTLQVVGVDLSERMIEYAQAQALATHLPARFQVMNILTSPLPFEENSFDLVNMRLLIGILYPEQWPAQESVVGELEADLKLLGIEWYHLHQNEKVFLRESYCVAAAYFDQITALLVQEEQIYVRSESEKAEPLQQRR